MEFPPPPRAWRVPKEAFVGTAFGVFFYIFNRRSSLWILLIHFCKGCWFDCGERTRRVLFDSHEWDRIWEEARVPLDLKRQRAPLIIFVRLSVTFWEVELNICLLDIPLWKGRKKNGINAGRMGIRNDKYKNEHLTYILFTNPLKALHCSSRSFKGKKNL